MTRKVLNLLCRQQHYLPLPGWRPLAAIPWEWEVDWHPALLYVTLCVILVILITPGPKKTPPFWKFGCLICTSYYTAFGIWRVRARMMTSTAFCERSVKSSAWSKPPQPNFNGIWVAPWNVWVKTCIANSITSSLSSCRMVMTINTLKAKYLVTSWSYAT